MDADRTALHVAVDARLYHYSQAGIGQYTRRLVQAIVAAAPAAQFTLLQMSAASEPLVRAPNVRVRRLRTPCHHRFEQWGLALELRRFQPDVFHAPDFIPPLRRRFPAVITVHDLAFLRYPEFLTAESRRYYGQIHRAVLDAEAIIAVSESTRRDLLALTAAPPERIYVIPEAADPACRPYAPEELRAALAELGWTPPPEGYFLFVGTIEPRKNLPLLLEAFAAARGRGLRQRLVIAGRPGWLYADSLARVRALGLDSVVEFLGPVAADHLPVLYNGAVALVMPSHYEGFGLPALEAMACGTPALLANVSSLPEIAGDAAVLLPLEVEAWAEALYCLGGEPERRAALSRRALAQAAHFSWEKAAAETLAVYRAVAA